MQGFKSFADKTVLEFKPGITAVIGPNGSGKSNISDSIRWVLGEQSMKSLRGAKSEDIIFAGTQNRKSLGFAEASIVIDNTDGELPVEYAEVIVTRKIYGSGETGYFINKTPCRLKDILELFMDTGIGKDGYSIIGQGKIDEILSNKSEDRRHIFEEAAGIVKYRARKSESEKKLEQTKLNLLRINDILSEIEAGLDPLRIQSEKAKRFLELHESLKDIEVGLFIHNIETYKEKLEQVVEDLKILENQKNDEEKKLNNIQNKKGTLKKQIDEFVNALKDVEHTEQDKMSISLYIKSRKLVKCEINTTDENGTETIATAEKEDNKLTVKTFEANEMQNQISIAKDENTDATTYTINVVTQDLGEGSNIQIKMGFKNLSKLDDVEESIEATIEYGEDSNKSAMQINYNNTITFIQNAEIESFNSDNVVVLNDTSEDELNNLLETIYENLGLE